MPLGVDEYRIAQLYMIAKKSRLESEGADSGVEIIKNEPYSEGPGGSGQYTDKLYHIEAHLPVWLRGFLPKALSTVREEAWNAYPYSKNCVTTPHLERFTLDMESKYLPGGTKRENVFRLDKDELAERVVDVMDFVNDYSGADNVVDENPLLFKSTKTDRGPLEKDWLKKCEANGVCVEEESNNDFMCVYKIIKVKFERWPITYRVEQFIHDMVRKTLVRAHRQAWAWQDEWHGLTIEQIRDMERETQVCLAKLLNKDQATSNAAS